MTVDDDMHQWCPIGRCNGHCGLCATIDCPVREHEQFGADNLNNIVAEICFSSLLAD